MSTALRCDNCGITTSDQPTRHFCSARCTADHFRVEADWPPQCDSKGVKV